MRLTWLAMIALPALVTGIASADLSLVKTGEPQAKIVHLDQEGVAEIATELQTYLEKMSGATIEIERMSLDQPPEPNSVFLVYGDEMLEMISPGLTDALEMDGFLQNYPGDNKLGIGARNLAGLQYGVYDFLEQLGCRWYIPLESGENVPQREDISVPEMTKLENPDMILRSVWYGYGGRPAWQKEGYAKWRMRNKMGGVGAGMGHNLYRVVPRDKFAETHPEYFPLISGERHVPAEGENHGWQPCTSNPDVVKLAVEAARAAFDANPDLYTFSLSPNDGYGWCECESCTALDPPELRGEARHGKGRRMLVFANQVAEELAKTHPDKYVCFYAYAGSVEPPTDVKAHPNVVVAVARIAWSGCALHELEDPRCERNANLLAILEGWSQVADKIFVREYFAGTGSDLWGEAGADGLAYVVSAYNFAHDIPYYHNHKVMGISCSALTQYGIVGLNFYLTAKLMWNVEEDVEALLDDYYQGMYGPAAEPMRNYFEAIVEMVRERAHKTSLFTDDDFPPLKTLLEEAERRCETDKQRGRVKLSQDYFDYVMKLRRLSLTPTDEALHDVLAFADSLKNGQAIDYTRHQACLNRPPQAKPGGRGTYTGPPLKPASADEMPAEAAELGPAVRGGHGFVILAEEGDSFTITVKVQRLGRYLDYTTASLLDPDGEEAGITVAGIGAEKTITVESAVGGIYNLIVNSGSNACRVYGDARNFALWGNRPHFLGVTPGLYFLLKPEAKSFKITLRTASPGETATLTLCDPEGNVVAEGNTVTQGSYTAQVAVPEQFARGAWSFSLTEAEADPPNTCEDNEITLGPNVLPYLVTHPSRLILPD